MNVSREMVARSGSKALPVRETPESLHSQIVAPDGLMAMEHARQSIWEQGIVGVLCGVGGCLLAYWSLQGIIGLVVIVLCVAFSTLVTAALCHYYDHSVRQPTDGTGLRPAMAHSRMLPGHSL